VVRGVMRTMSTQSTALEDAEAGLQRKDREVKSRCGMEDVRGLGGAGWIGEDAYRHNSIVPS
jgi:hypothetical protein